MAKGRKLVKYRKKKRRKRRPGVSTLRVRIKSAPISDRYFCNLSYSMLAANSSTSFIAQVLRGNSPYDPDFSGTGGQPLGYDQVANFFNRYRVHSSRITVRAIPDVTNIVPTVVNVCPVDTTTGLIGILQATETVYAKNKLLPATAVNSTNFTCSMTTKRKLGYKDISQEDDLASLTTTNPAEQWYWHISQSPADGLSSVKVHYMIKIDYNVEFFDRRELLRS